MEPFRVEELLVEGKTNEATYREFLREDSLSVGLYTVPAGGEDPQTPHTEDEVYHVVSGRSNVRIDDAVYPVEPGSVIFVERGVDHRFVDVEETLTTLVFFAPAEGTFREGETT